MHPSNQTNPAPIRPQNLSCPAGGSRTHKQAQTQMADAGGRGVTVAPPSGNTDDPRRYTILHCGFDTLTLAIQAHIGPELFDNLECERNRAEEEQRELVFSYNGLQLHLKPHGSRGYRFLLDGGPDGARWAIKKPNTRDGWGFNVTFGSQFLALNGLGAAKAHCDFVLDRLGVRFTADDISISRADYCIDILANGFVLNPDQLVMHSAMKRSDYYDTKTDDTLRVHGKSGRVTSVTAGSVTNRQAIIYDKRAEVIARGKAHWWDIWNHTLYKGINGTTGHYIDNIYNRDDVALLSPDPDKATDNQVWRVEFRAGKSLLKDRWGIRTWAQLFDRYGDLCRESAEKVKYTEPDPTDTNRARWSNHLLWEMVCAEMNDDLTEMRSGADPNPMKEVHREQLIGTVFRNVLGCSITLAALNGRTVADLPDVFTQAAQQMKNAIKANPTKTERQLREAKERYVFIQKPTPPQS
jgi:hypothetical protein